METKKNKHLLFGLGVYALVFFALLLVTNIGHVGDWINGILYLLRPVLIGLVIAYLCNPFFRFFERKLFVKIKPPSLRRAIALFFTYLTLFLIFAILLMLIVPQLISSISSFIAESENHIDRTIGEVNALIDMINQKFADGEATEPMIKPLDAEELKESLSNFFQSIQLDNETLLSLLNPNLVHTVFNLAENIVLLITDIILGLFISLYLLNTKEKRYAQVMRARRAFLSDSVNEKITLICTTADKSFGGFIKGKMLDSCMVGILVYIAISLLQVPYAILIAVIVGITDFVPVIGPFIGVIPSAVIILLTDPGKVIPFLLCILIVQQFDGNILAPKILGENTGVSSLCVLIAITLMGSLWGLVGMVLGVPLFATVLELSGIWLNKRLEKKGLPSNVDYYTQDPAAMPKQEQESNLIRRFQKKRMLRLQQESVGGKGDLTTFERFQLDTYALMQKYNLTSHKNEEIPEAFVEEESVLTETAIEQVEAELAKEQEEAESKEALAADSASADGAREADTSEDKTAEKAPQAETEEPTEKGRDQLDQTENTTQQ